MRYLFFIGGLAAMLGGLALPFVLTDPWFWAGPPTAFLGAMTSLLSLRAMKRHNKRVERKALTKIPGDKERIPPQRKILPKKNTKLE